MTTFTRTSKATGEVTALTLDAAVDLFIRDNHAYGEVKDNVEDYLSDMSTVFETQSMIEDMEGELDAGDYIYTKN